MGWADMLSIARYRSRFLSYVFVAVLLTFLQIMPVAAQSSSSITQSFNTDDSSITAAALVSIEDGDANKVELSGSKNSDRIVGVVSDDSLIELSDGTSGVQVVTSGLTMTLVSDINGSVSNGDKITASPIEGVGMKATESVAVVGTAQGSLEKAEVETREITDKDGNKKDVRIGLIPVQVSTAYYSVVQEDDSSFMPAALQNIANNIAGRNVSPVRVLAASLILVLLFISITVLVYSAVRSSIISIGRNPLSKSAVNKSLYEVGITVLAVLAFSILVIYLILTI